MDTAGLINGYSERRVFEGFSAAAFSDWLAYFKDPDDNIFGVWEQNPSAE